MPAGNEALTGINTLRATLRPVHGEPYLRDTVAKTVPHRAPQPVGAGGLAPLTPVHPGASLPLPTQEVLIMTSLHESDIPTHVPSIPTIWVSMCWYLHEP